ncbi:4'-phosphopantetheinyl transferase family protein [Terrimonas pollutisoli]|uniref:4'-phosphopantetheinyl transferase family protein n=1 Tax=Terrimonas pollutisoli TaxID=3034147 RepID=UPI0023ED335F|nr:4'-phosphopantetheinyl transferase superfamily protein [Terrimonas sp. H1YJ31]
MPIFFQHQINESTRLGIWKIEETEEFFKGNVPLHRDVTHPHKRIQHLAGRFLLQFLFPDFPYHLIQIADTDKPFLPAEEYHFSISHCGDYAAAIVSKNNRVGIDIEIPVDKIIKVRNKFLGLTEQIKWLEDATGNGFNAGAEQRQLLTLLWSCKESVFKWYGDGGVDFSEQIQLQSRQHDKETIQCFFTKAQVHLSIHYRLFDQLVLSWVVS